MTRSEFRSDAQRSRLLLEDVSGSSVIGYRAAGFSSTASTPWFFAELCASGYRYDSSVFPARRGHGGNPDSPLRPYVPAGGGLIGLPVTVTQLGPARICFFGGGHLRLCPYPIIRYMSRRVLASGAPLVFYIHPREIDPDHPRIRMPYHRRFKSYVNLHTTEDKIRNILREFPVTTCRNVLFPALPKPALRKPVPSANRATRTDMVAHTILSRQITPP